MHLQLNRQWTYRLLQSAIIFSGSSSFMYGYGIAATNLYSNFIDDLAFNRMNNNGSFSGLKAGIGNGLFVVGNLIGAIATPHSSNCLWIWHRKRMMILNYVMASLCSALALLSTCRQGLILFYLSRLFHGVQGGMACVIVPAYLNEIRPATLGWSIVHLHQLFITLGIFTAQLMGIRFIFGTKSRWQIGLAAGSVTCLFALYFLNDFTSDSPVEMFFVFRNEDRAREALVDLRPSPLEAEDELIRMCGDYDRITAENNTQISIFNLFRRRDMAWQIVTTTIMMIVQAFSGINAIFFYSGKLLYDVGFSSNSIQFLIIFTGFANCITTTAILALINRLSRRCILFFSISVVFVSQILLGTNFVLKSTTGISNLNWITFPCMLFLVLGFAIGLGPMPFLYVGEVFRPEAKDAALGIALFVNYTSNIIVAFVFPQLNLEKTGYAFFTLAAITLLSTALLYVKIPETRGLSTEEIDHAFSISIPIAREIQ
ncbi:hypothetical protein ACOME3_003923 [Neoechinorhynchus agilis]